MNRIGSDVTSRTLPRTAVALFVVASLAACASGPPKAPYSGGGTVVSVVEVDEPSTVAMLAGAIGGAAIGGVAGANIGGGSGQIVGASVLSAVTGTLGASAGRWLGSRTRYQVLVRGDDGIDRTIVLDALPAVRPGAKVRVEAGALTASP